MRIAVNLWQYLPGRIGGQEHFIRAVVESLARDPHGHELTILAHIEARKTLAALAPGAELRMLDWQRNGGSAIGLLDPGAHDVLFCPQLGLDPPDPGLPAAATIPDLIPALAPEHFPPAARLEREQLLRNTIARAQVVFTHSQFSRRAILDRYAIDAARVVLAPDDVPPEFRREPAAGVERLLAPLGLPQRYVIFPANYWPHKNHAGAIAAIELLAGENADVGLVLSGAESAGAARVRRLIEERGLAARVRMLPYQPIGTLVEVFRRADALLYPSYMEGFGIPILEAFHLDVPVVTSGAGGAAEVVGDAGIIVDPANPPSIAAGLARVLDDADLRAELVARGRRRAGAYSWAATCATITATLELIARGETPRAQPISP